MRNQFLILAGLVFLAGCAVEVPGFLGREGSGEGTFRLGGEDPLPDPVPVPMRARRGRARAARRDPPGRGRRADPGLLRRRAARRRRVRTPPASSASSSPAGPPALAEAVGPERTRQLTAAVFLPNLALEDLRGVRVAGGGAVRTLPRCARASAAARPVGCPERPSIHENGIAWPSQNLIRSPRRG